MKIGTEVRAVLAPWSDSLEFLILQRMADGQRAYAEPVTLRVESQSCMSPLTPTFSLSRTAAQELMDNLWTCGLRPSEGTGSAGALAATQKHLDDMRRLVFEDKSPTQHIQLDPSVRMGDVLDR